MKHFIFLESNNIKGTRVGWWWDGSPPTSQIFAHFFPTRKKFLASRLPPSNIYLPLAKGFSILVNKNFHCSCIIFILTSYSLYTQIMLILILIDVPYFHNVVFSFKNGMNGQNPTLSNSYRTPTFSISPPLNNIWRTLGRYNLQVIPKEARCHRP